MQLKDLNDLNVTESAGAEEIDRALDVVEATWPRIIDYDQQNPKASIEFALNLIRSASPSSNRIRGRSLGSV
ncbi:hypothetical protein AB1Y20_012144 [Prymnesium parvum]|uniref:Uncharacterized protein n=1 Tax=Prymnesium parvum TaxID=97485 RepID=A0AB34IMM4_PRYPA